MTAQQDQDALPPGYPREWEADVVLRDGTVAQVRPITPADIPALHRFHEAQSAESVYLRFFAPVRRLSDRDVRRFAHVDYVGRVALVLTVGDELVGIARYDRVPGPTDSVAEVAFNVSDRFQGRGVGSVLLEHLAAIGREGGVTRFVADVLPQNRKMLAVFTDAGYEVRRKLDDGVVALHFDIEPTEQSEEVRAAREQRAEAVSVRALLSPTSVAVVGVGRREGSTGRLVLRHLLQGGFTGRVHAVALHGEEVEGHPTVTSVEKIPEPVDLAVLALPADAVLPAVHACARRGARALLVLSAGFADADPQGEERQRLLLSTARRHGMRVVGPGSMGIVNTREEVRLNAALLPRMPRRGRLGLFTQSGALGVAVLRTLDSRGLGLCDFVSAGNRVDVSGNDLMQYWFDDDDTAAVGLYLESMGNPRKFSRIARRLAARKPVIVVKPDVSSRGLPRGHRVRPTQARPDAFRAMLRQAGVIRVGTVHELFDVAQLVVHQPAPRGDRVAVVGNSDALASLAADEAVSRGLHVAHGPVFLGGDAGPVQVEQALAAAFADPAVDSVVVGLVSPLGATGAEMVRALARTAGQFDKPCVATLAGIEEVVPQLRAVHREEGVRPLPCYPMPQEAVTALAAATRYGQWRVRDRGRLVVPEGIDRARAEQVVQRVLAQSPAGRRLEPAERDELLACYGIEVWPAVAVADPDEGVVAARELGYPVVLKSVSPLVRHQPVTALRADIRSDRTLREAYAALDERLAPLGANRFVVQRMAVPGVACVLGSSEDPLFGPVVRFSLSGPPTELLDDIGYRIPPLTDVDVRDLLDSVKAAPLLHGHRGAALVDRAALEDLVARVSVLADHLPEVADLELNPVSCHQHGLEVLGAEIAVTPPGRRTDAGRRSLT